MGDGPARPGRLADEQEIGHLLEFLPSRGDHAAQEFTGLCVLPLEPELLAELLQRYRKDLLVLPVREQFVEADRMGLVQFGEHALRKTGPAMAGLDEFFHHRLVHPDADIPSVPRDLHAVDQPEDGALRQGLVLPAPDGREVDRDLDRGELLQGFPDAVVVVRMPDEAAIGNREAEGSLRGVEPVELSRKRSPLQRGDLICFSAPSTEKDRKESPKRE